MVEVVEKEVVEERVLAEELDVPSRLGEVGLGLLSKLVGAGAGCG